MRDDKLPRVLLFVISLKSTIIADEVAILEMITERDRQGADAGRFLILAAGGDD